MPPGSSRCFMQPGRLSAYVAIEPLVACGDWFPPARRSSRPRYSLRWFVLCLIVAIYCAAVLAAAALLLPAASRIERSPAELRTRSIQTFTLDLACAGTRCCSHSST